MRHNVVAAEAAAEADIEEMWEHYPYPWMSVALETGRLEEGLPYKIFGSVTREPDHNLERGFGELLSLDEIITLGKKREAADYQLLGTLFQMYFG